MLFTDYSFFAFVGGLFLLYYLLPRRCQWPLLLVGSGAFYCFAGVRAVPYLLSTILTTYLCARILARSHRSSREYLAQHKDALTREERRDYQAARKRVRRRWLAGCILLNLLILGAVKYGRFAAENLSGLSAALGGPALSFPALALPLGVSFYTLQALGYLIDVYRGTVEAEENPFKLALFLSFFPLLVQGPICRFGDLRDTLFAPHPFETRRVCRGLQRILWGYFKKLVVADRIAAAVGALTADPQTYRGAWAAVLMVFYTVQLYADFTGGIDVTIGVAQLFGVEVKENFLRPYFSKSLAEYWRRWHISMCAWFRDYLFYPVSTSPALQRLTRWAKGRLGPRAGRRVPMYLASLLVWAATGLWHGASWNFLAWGLANWAVLMLSEELEPLYQRFHQRFHLRGRLFYRVFQVGRTFALICVLNLFDCFSALGDTFGLLASLLTARNWAVLWDGSLLTLGLGGVDYAVLALGCLLMLAVSLAQRRCGVRERLARAPYPARCALWLALLLAVLLMGAYGPGYDASQFIYNRF